MSAVGNDELSGYYFMKKKKKTRCFSLFVRKYKVYLNVEMILTSFRCTFCIFTLSITRKKKRWIESTYWMGYVGILCKIISNPNECVYEYKK